MGARDLSHALILAAPFALGTSAAAAVQDAGDAHLLEVYLERRLALEQAWEAAGPEARERARAALAPGVGEDAFTPSARRAARALRLLDDTRERSTDTRAEAISDSIDLRLLPAVLEAGERARGEPLVARVRGLWPAPAGAGSFELTLVWLAPGGEELRAATERVHPAAIAAGFEIYFHSPLARTGTWRLVPEVTTEDGSARGFPLTVDCVAVRSAAAAAERARPPVAVLYGDGNEPLGVELVPAPELPTGVLLVVSPPLEDLVWTFAGARAAAWREVVDAGWRVVATRQPLDALASSDALAPGGERAALLRAVDLDRLDVESLELDRLVLLARAGGELPELEHGGEVLVLELDAARDAVRPASERTTSVRLDEPAPLACRAAPAWIARWLAGALAEGDR